MAIFNEEFLREMGVRKDSQSIESTIENFYHHLLKWRYQPTHQSSSWANTIISESRDIFSKCYIKKSENRYEADENIVNELNLKLETLYAQAIKRTISVIPSYKTNINSDKSASDSVIKIFKTIEDIIQLNLIVDYAYHYATENGKEKLAQNSIILDGYSGEHKNELLLIYMDLQNKKDKYKRKK